MAFGPVCREVGSGLGTQVRQAPIRAWFFYTLPCRLKGHLYSFLSAGPGGWAR